MYPVPLSPSIKSIPSTKISSFVSNNGSVNPKIGVAKVQVATPEFPVTIELIPTPLELLIAITLCGSDFNPYIGAIWLTSEIAPLGVTAIKEELSITVFVLSFHNNKFGAFKYLDPPKTISISLIVSRLSRFIMGEINASGVKVLSDGYSYPISLILTFLILPIDVEMDTTFAFCPFSVITPSNFGSLLKLNPSERIFIFPIAPFIAVEDFVEYSNVSVWSLVYFRTVGTLDGDILNESVDTPKIL